MKLVRLIANLGYGSRKEAEALIENGRVTNAKGAPWTAKDAPPTDDVFIDGAAIDPPAPLVLLLNKPKAYVCARDEIGRSVYELLPPRFRLRKPALSTVGRLDKDTEGLLIITDDGQFLHRIISPRAQIWKRYGARLERPLQGHEAAAFASGALMLNGETKPLLPARLKIIGPHEAEVEIQEGRYHQVRRMFAAVGNHVTDLHRLAVGGLELPPDLTPGQWRAATAEECERIFT